jgi:hypothetical protein
MVIEGGSYQSRYKVVIPERKGRKEERRSTRVKKFHGEIRRYQWKKESFVWSSLKSKKKSLSFTPTDLPENNSISL